MRSTILAATATTWIGLSAGCASQQGTGAGSAATAEPSQRKPAERLPLSRLLGGCKARGFASRTFIDCGSHTIEFSKEFASEAGYYGVAPSTIMAETRENNPESRLIQPIAGKHPALFVPNINSDIGSSEDELFTVVASEDGQNLTQLHCVYPRGKLDEARCVAIFEELLRIGDVPEPLHSDAAPERVQIFDRSIPLPEAGCERVSDNRVRCPVHGEISWLRTPGREEARRVISEVISGLKTHPATVSFDEREVGCAGFGGEGECRHVVLEESDGGTKSVFHALFSVVSLGGDEYGAVICSFKPELYNGGFSPICTRVVHVER